MLEDAAEDLDKTAAISKLVFGGFAKKVRNQSEVASVRSTNEVLLCIRR